LELSFPRSKRRAASTVALLTLGAAVVAVLAPAAARAGTAPPAPSAPAGALTVVDQTFGVTGGQPLTLSMSATGIAVAADAVLSISVHPAISSLDQLDAEPAPPIDTVVRPLGAVATLDASGSGSGSIATATALGDAVAADPTLQVGSPGIHRITVTISSGGQTVASTATHVFVVDPAAEPAALQVAVVAGTADPGPWPDTAHAAASLADLDALMDLADRVDAPLTFSLPPSVTALATPPPAATPDGSVLPDVSPVPDSSPVATESPGTPSTSSPGDAAATARVERLSTAFDGDDVLPLPFVALDPSSLAAVDQGDLFTRQLRAGEDVLSATVPLARSDRAAWLTGGAISRPAASSLRVLGTRTLVVPAALADQLGVGVDPVLGAVFDVDLGDGRPMPAMALSPLGDRLAASDDPAADAAELVASLLLAAGDAPRAVALATGDGSIPDAELTARVTAYARQVPGVEIVPLSALPGRAAPTGDEVVELPESAGADLSERVDSAALVRLASARARSMLVDPEPARRWDVDFDRMLSSAVDDTTAMAHLDAVSREVDSILHAIVLPEPFTFTLTGTSSKLPIRLENTSPYALNVAVRVSSAKLSAEGGDAIEQVEANSSRTVELPVRARSNGSFSVEVSVLTPDLAQRVAGPTVLRANVTQLSGLSKVLTAGALLALASWWFSHFRRRRRLARATAVPPDDDIAGPLEP